MIDKAAFEAIVRAEAEMKYPAPAMLDYDDVRLWKFDDSISIARREAYIAARMEHEWPLVEAAQAVVDRWDTPLWKDVPHTGSYIGRLRDALSHYTKPIER